MGKLQHKVRSWDWFGAKIGVSYKGENEFKTVFGGCISIILTFLLVISGAVQIYNVFFDIEYRQNISTAFEAYSEDENLYWNLTT